MRKQVIEEQLSTLAPVHLEVIDESHRHSVPAGSESHFNITVVTQTFHGMGRVDRHRRIHELLQGEFDKGLHALTLTLLTPTEFEAKGGVSLSSPNCMGGSKQAG